MTSASERAVKNPKTKNRKIIRMKMTLQSPSFRVTWNLRDATANLSNLAFVVRGASATTHGTYQLETHKIDLHGILKSEAELSKMSSGFKSVLLRPFNGLFKKKHAGAVVPVHLVGTYEDPQPGVDVVPKNPPHDASAAKK
jgi:hypothetical protein